MAVAVQIPPETARSLGGGAHPIRFRMALREHDHTRAELSEKSTFVVPR